MFALALCCRVAMLMTPNKIKLTGGVRRARSAADRRPVEREVRAHDSDTSRRQSVTKLTKRTAQAIQALESRWHRQQPQNSSPRRRQAMMSRSVDGSTQAYNRPEPASASERYSLAEALG